LEARIMSFLDDCKEFSRGSWFEYENHPWIHGLADGKLKAEQFVQFQIDDGVHVVDFNRALALGIAKAPPDHSWALAAATILNSQSTVAELNEKQALIRELGFDKPVRSDRWGCSPAREGYVNHLVRVAYEGTLAHIATSLYPCSLFTQVIGQRFEGVEIPGAESFRKWADIYVRPTRRQMCAEHAAVIEDAAAKADSAERSHLLWLYRRSLEHQVRVFDAAWALEGDWPGQRATGR
jgi:thiaminase (transcriptional activator TenA)